MVLDSHENCWCTGNQMELFKPKIEKSYFVFDLKWLRHTIQKLRPESRII